MHGLLIIIILLFIYFIYKKSKEGLDNSLDGKLLDNSLDGKKMVTFNEEDFYSKTLGLSSGDIVYDDQLNNQLNNQLYGLLIEYNPYYDNYVNKDILYNNDVNYGYNKNFDNCFKSYGINPKNKILLFFGTDGKKLYLFPVNKSFLQNKKIKKRNTMLDQNQLQRLIVSINKFYEINYVKNGEIFVQELLMDANIIPYYINQTYNKLFYSDNSFNTIKRDDNFNYLFGYMNSYIYV